MARRHYLVSYDISDDKRRNKLFNLLEGEGDRVQYSVFFCDCNAMELARLRARIAEIIHHRDDQVLLLDLGPAEHPLAHNLDVLGAPYKPPARVIVV